MDKGLRNALRLATVACRKTLEADFALQLEGTFGIERNGEVQPETRLTHLTPRQWALRRQIVATIAHRQAGGATAAEAVTRFVREAAFSTLNRLAALKLMEAPERDLIQESIGAGSESRGFRQFTRLSPEALRAEPDGGYALYLDLIAADLAKEIGVLFDRDAPQAALTPSTSALNEVLGRLNDPALAMVWSEDETLGWIYQYFTPKEQRDEARKASAAPRNSYELAFRNQFFTPRYVVEFLTDNTLGRTWYEMQQGRTALAQTCRYMVIRPDEVFLSSQERRRSQDPDAAFLLGDTDTMDPFRVPVTEWRGGEEIEDRVFTMPWSDIGAHGSRLTHFAHFARPFAWTDDPRWDTWRPLLESLNGADAPGTLDERTQDLWDLLLALARAERFADGTVEAHAGAMTAIANEIRRRLLTAQNLDATTEDRLRAPYLVPHRAKKEPREIRILDPACGSGHFLLYAFDLLLTIYDEAYDDEDLGPALQRDYEDREAFRRAVPELILRHNLHGVDIDLRAVQIAQLALWLRAQRAYAAWEVKSADRPRITRVNIVTAEPLPGDEELRTEFQRTLGHPAIERLVADVWTELDSGGPIDEIGSLLKADVLVRNLVAQHKRDWQSGEVYVPTRLFGETQPEQARLDLDYRFISDEAFWQEAEREVLEALRRFAESANGDRYRRRLFAEDAAQGFALMELFREPFDVVLMNPPFGLPTSSAKHWAKNAYPETWQDIYGMFMDRALSLVGSRNGFVGAITPKSYYHAKGFKGLRRLLKTTPYHLDYSVDFGGGVLDAAVEVCLSLLRANAKNSSFHTTWFLNMVSEPRDLLAESVRQRIEEYSAGSSDKQWTLIDMSASKILPNEMLPYRFPPDLLNLFTSFPPFEPEFGSSVAGLTTFDNERFIRCRWEVSASSLKVGDWMPVTMGGGWAPFYDELSLVIRWRNDAEEMRCNEMDRYGTTARTTQSKQYWFRPGLTFSEVSTLGFSVQPFPASSIFAGAGFCIFPEGFNLWVWLGYFNSKTVASIMSLFSAERHWNNNNVGSIPIPALDEDSIKELAILAYEAAAKLGLRSETSPYFINNLTIIGEAERSNYDYATANIDRIVVEALGLSNSATEFLAQNATFKERQLVVDEDSLVPDTISYALGCAFGRWDIRMGIDPTLAPEPQDPFDPLPVCPPGLLVDQFGLPANHGMIASRERPKARAKETSLPTEGSVAEPSIPEEAYPLRIDWDGILVDDEGHGDDIVGRVRDVLSLLWGDRAEVIEQEACSILGVRSLRDYFRNPKGFWDFHVKRYSKSRRKAPIYWLLQSSKRAYGLWLYYPRLDTDTLFKALGYVGNRLLLEQNRLEEALGQQRPIGGGDARMRRELDKRIEAHEAFISEVSEFRAELQRVADLGITVDHDDGVLLSIAPLHNLVPWPPAKTAWNELLAGKYGWSSIGKQLRAKGIVQEKARG